MLISLNRILTSSILIMRSPISSCTYAILLVSLFISLSVSCIKILAKNVPSKFALSYESSEILPSLFFSSEIPLFILHFEFKYLVLVLVK